MTPQEILELKNDAYRNGLQDGITHISMVLLENPLMKCIDLANMIEVYHLEQRMKQSRLLNIDANDQRFDLSGFIRKNKR